jgi:hypothetical protein
MSDADLCAHIESALAQVRKSVKDNLAYIAQARKRFAQPGCRVPVEGRPTWGRWIKQNLGISDRHVRRLLAEYRDPAKKRKPKKAEPRIEVESAAVIFGNIGLEMAKKLRDGDTESAKKIALQMLEADTANPDSLMPIPAPEPIQIQTIDAGDVETLASVWMQVFEPLPSGQRLSELMRFLCAIPAELVEELATAITPDSVKKTCSDTPDETPTKQPEAAPTDHAPNASPEAESVPKKLPISVKVTVCPPVLEAEGEDSADRRLPDSSDYKPVAITEAGYALNEDGKWEYVGKPEAVA